MPDAHAFTDRRTVLRDRAHARVAERGRARWRGADLGAGARRRGASLCRTRIGRDIGSRPGTGRCWGRSGTDAGGRFEFVTEKPVAAAAQGPAPRRDRVRARPAEALVTRMYFPDEAEANAAGSRAVRARRRATRARSSQAAKDGSLRFDIRMQGDRQTVFFARVTPFVRDLRPGRAARRRLGRGLARARCSRPSARSRAPRRGPASSPARPPRRSRTHAIRRSSTSPSSPCRAGAPAIRPSRSCARCGRGRRAMRRARASRRDEPGHRRHGRDARRARRVELIDEELAGAADACARARGRAPATR